MDVVNTGLDSTVSDEHTAASEQQSTVNDAVSLAPAVSTGDAYTPRSYGKASHCERIVSAFYGSITVR